MKSGTVTVYVVRCWNNLTACPPGELIERDATSLPYGLNKLLDVDILTLDGRCLEECRGQFI